MLESYVSRERQQTDTRVNTRLLQSSMADTLYQSLQEISTRLGLSEEEFVLRFQKAARWHYDRHLQKASDSAPTLAARIDVRDPDQIPTETTPPRIFPDDD
jgi:hypothetical protein